MVFIVALLTEKTVGHLSANRVLAVCQLSLSHWHNGEIYTVSDNLLPSIRKFGPQSNKSPLIN